MRVGSLFAMNYATIGIELVRLIAYLVVSWVMFGYILKVTLEAQGPELIKQVLSMDQKQLQQLMSVDKRVQKTADQRIAKDLMETSPLAPVLGMLTKETRAYLIAHPETLPGVLQNYAGPLDIGLKLLPQLVKIFPDLKGQLQKAAPTAKFDY